MTTTLPLMLALTGLALSVSEGGIVSEVSLQDGACVFWTGDVGLDAAQFREELRDSRDRHGRDATAVIFHAADVPARCVERARRLARAAGYHNIEVRLGTPDLGPPQR